MKRVRGAVKGAIFGSIAGTIICVIAAPFYLEWIVGSADPWDSFSFFLIPYLGLFLYAVPLGVIIGPIVGAVTGAAAGVVVRHGGASIGTIYAGIAGATAGGTLGFLTFGFMLRDFMTFGLNFGGIPGVLLGVVIGTSLGAFVGRNKLKELWFLGMGPF